MGVFTFLNLRFLSITTIYAKAFNEVMPSEGTVKIAMQDNATNPFIQDAVNNHMVPTGVITIMGTTDPEQYKDLPTFLSQIALLSSVNGAVTQSKNKSGDQKNVFNYATRYVMQTFPGYTNNPNDKVRIKNIACEASQLAQCPKNYTKVNLKNFEQRQLDDIATLSKEQKKPVEDSSSSQTTTTTTTTT